MKNMFNETEANEVIARIEQLTPDSQRQWGTMDVAQMLAHCCVTYEYVFENKHKKPNFLKKLIFKWFVKPIVVGPKPYDKNNRTAPDFIMKGDKDFALEKGRLIDYIKKTQALGAVHFDNKESHSFGKLTKDEWNTMFYKHLDHHLKQFGV